MTPSPDAVTPGCVILIPYPACARMVGDTFLAGHVERGQKALLDQVAVSDRQHFWGVLAGDAGLNKDRTAAAMHQVADALRLAEVGNMKRLGEAAPACNGGEVDAGRGVARLHAGLAIMLVVEHDDDEIA